MSFYLSRCFKQALGLQAIHNISLEKILYYFLFNCCLISMLLFFLFWYKIASNIMMMYSITSLLIINACIFAKYQRSTLSRWLLSRPRKTIKIFVKCHKVANAKPDVFYIQYIQYSQYSQYIHV